MKKIFFLLSAWIVTNTAFAQSGNAENNSSAGKKTYFSTNSTKICYYNKKTKKYDKCVTYKVSTVFEVNAGRTVFTHTTSDQSSTYYIQNSRYNQQYKYYSYAVVSDVGNKYTFLVSKRGKYITILKGTGDDSYNMYFTVNRKWKKRN